VVNCAYGYQEEGKKEEKVTREKSVEEGGV
jgi:hypothetical protein